MSRPRDRAPVVVGVDGAGSSADAVDWACAEAAARGCPLRIVHAFQQPVPADPYGVLAPLDSPVTARDLAQSVLAEAVARAASIAPDISVSALLCHGTPTRALRTESAGAQLLVLGTRGLSGLRGLLARSVSAHVSAHASCPVVVIHPAPREDSPTFSPPRVVVGVDTTTSCAPAIGFAFRAARQRGIPLFAVHAWTPDPPADLEAISGQPTIAEAIARRTLDRALERRGPGFADVPVHAVLVRGDPAIALLAASRGAALVVLGSSSRGSVRGTALGSVSRSVLHHGHGPLAIVRQVPDPVPAPDEDPGHQNSRRWGYLRDRRSPKTDDRHR